MLDAATKPGDCGIIRIADAAMPVAPVSPAAGCGDVHDQLHAEPDTVALLLVQESRWASSRRLGSGPAAGEEPGCTAHGAPFSIESAPGSGTLFPPPRARSRLR